MWENVKSFKVYEYFCKELEVVLKQSADQCVSLRAAMQLY